MSSIALLDHFSALKDPRQAWKVIYPLPEILLTVLCATMAGAEDFADIERWAKRNELMVWMPPPGGVVDCRGAP